MRIPRKAALAVLASVSIAGLAGASAASFGGVTSGSLGSENAIVAACDTNGMSVTYTTAYDSATQSYRVSSVNFTAVDVACNGKNATLTLSNNTTGTLTTLTANPLAVTSNAFAMTVSPSIDAAALDKLSLLIVG